MGKRFCFVIIGACLILLSSCTVYQKVFDVVVEQVTDDYNPDLSCSYFYFLWGAHAESTGRNSEALEAYEKALICDPRAAYIREKIPVILLKLGDYDKASSWLQQALQDYPDDDYNRLLLASLDIQQNKIEEAVSLYNEILQRDPNNQIVQLRLALLFIHQENYDKAEELLRRILEKDQDAYYAQVALARLQKQKNNHQEAIRYYKSALELNWSKELAFELGNYLSVLKKFEEALAVYEDIIENDPQDERASLSRAQTFLDLERYDDALLELNNLKTFSKDPAGVEIIIAKVLLRKNEIEKAKTLLEQLVHRASNSEARYMLAVIAYKEGKQSLAVAHLNLIHPNSNEFEEAVYLQTNILKEYGEGDKAIALLKKYLDAKATRRPTFYALLAAFYHEKNDDAAAISLLERAVTQFPDNAQLYFDYGLILDKAGKEEEAITKMKKVLELQPNHAEALNYIGYTWAEKNTNLTDALHYIEKAVALKPQDSYIADSLGWVYYRLGDFQRAAEELERSLALEPKDPHIHDHLGDVYRALGRMSEAIKQYQEAETLFEDNKDKATMREKIDAISNMP
jgi:tetratricopeptide (TPR) repeat protein